MMSFCIVIRFYCISPFSTHLFAYMNGCCVLLVYCKQYFIHTMFCGNYQPLTEDFGSVPLSPCRNPDGISDASNIRHYIFCKLCPELELTNEFAVVNGPIMETG